MTVWFKCYECTPCFSFRQKVIMHSSAKTQKVSAMALFLTIWIFKILRLEMPSDIRWCYFSEEAWSELNK